MKIGVLALQGAFREHIHKLTTIGAAASEIRLPHQLEKIDGLIIPGGESTTIANIAFAFGLLPALKEFCRTKPTWGTCAGLILLADRVTGQKKGGQELIGGLDVTVDRNFFGRQCESFEANLDIPLLAKTADSSDPSGPFHAIFIRAPGIVETGENASILSQLKDGPVVAIRQGHLLGTAFHPELGDDLRFHRYFAQMVNTAKGIS